MEIGNDAVLLRALTSEDFEPLWAARGGAGSVATPERPGARERLLERIDRSPALVEGRLDLGIVSDERLVGTVEARQPREGLPPGCFEIGVGLFAPGDRGRGVGMQAVELFVQHLFDAHAAERVQGSTWVENAPMRRVFTKLGFTEEGVMRSFMPTSDGERHDYVLCGVTRAEWAARQTSR